MKQYHNATIQLSKRGFALLYVMVFTMMILAVIVMISGTLVTNIKLQRSSHSSIEAYNLARGAIDVAWGSYANALQIKEAVSAGRPDGLFINPYTYDDDNKIYTDPIYTPYLEYEYPAGACSGTYFDSGKDYKYLICYKGTKHFIKTTGQYQTNKVALQADITHKSPDIVNEYYAATVTIGETKTNPANPLVPGSVATTVCDGYAPPQSCGNDPGKSGLKLCTDVSFKNPLECDSSNPKKLTNIEFNHAFDKLEITQIPL